jgi:WD40 repeat protein
MLLEGHEDGVNGVKFSPDGSVVASAGADKVLHMWNVRGDCEVRCAAPQPDATQEITLMQQKVSQEIAWCPP